MEMLKPIPKDNKGLPNLPESVRNKMGYLAEGGIASLDNKIQKDFEYATEYGVGSELKKLFKKAGPAIGATIGAIIGGPAGAVIGAGIGTKTSASDNYAQNMLAAAGLAYGLGAQGQGLESFLAGPGDAFSAAFADIGSSPLGSLFTGAGAAADAAQAADQAKRITAYDVVTGKATQQEYLSQVPLSQTAGSAAADAAAAGSGNIFSRAVGGLERLYEENPVTARLAETLLFPKIVEAIYGDDPYGTSARMSFADQGLRGAVNPLTVNPYIEGSRVVAPQFPQLEEFVGAKRKMFGGKIGLKDGGRKPQSLADVMVKPDGEIRGPGTPTSDDIPVYLSDQEYVLPKVMVDYFGNGDYDNGVAALEQIRTRLV